MSDHPEPDWSLLPADPVAFFRLSAEFDARALKSAYGALVKQYKPEQSPEEFQRIRAAYESLQWYLDAGESRSPPPFDWGVAPSNDGADDGRKNAPGDPPHASERRPASEPSPTAHDQGPRAFFEPVSVRERHDAYLAIEHKTPRDYYALAVLSDLIEGAPRGFAEWLLAGLERFPEEFGLSRLLFGYCSTDEAAERAEDLLIAASQSVTTDHFYFVTRPLWERVIGATDGMTFRRLLEACEANLDGIHREGYFAFSWWLLRHAVWESDSTWFEAKLAELESHGDPAAWFGQHDQDLIDLLIAYRQTRGTIRGEDVIRREMDRALIACTTARKDIADARMSEAHAVLAARGADILRAFPAGKVGGEPLTILWEHFSDGAAERLGIPPLASDETTTTQIHRLAADLMAEGYRRGFHLVAVYTEIALRWVVKAFVGFLLVAFGLAGVVGLYDGLIIQQQWSMALVGAFAVPFVCWALTLVWDDLKQEQKDSVALFAWPYYRTVWRYQIQHFIETTGVPVADIVSGLTAVDGMTVNGWKIRAADFIAKRIAQDTGLRTYEIARRFLPRVEKK